MLLLKHLCISFTLPDTLSNDLPLSLSLSLSLSHTHIHTHTHTLSHTHTHTHSQANTHTNTYDLSHTFRCSICYCSHVHICAYGNTVIPPHIIYILPPSPN